MDENRLPTLLKSNVFRIERDELALNYKYYPMAKELDNISVLSIEYDLPEMKEEGYSFYPDYITPAKGDTYVKDPFNDKKLIRIENFAEEVLKSKQQCILRIASLLGATYAELSVEAKDSTAREWRLNVNGKYKVVKAKGSIDKKALEDIGRKYSTIAKFESTKTDYAKAEDLAKQYGLYNENDIQSLFLFRSPDNHVAVKSYEVHFSMSNEINNSLDIAFKLNVMDGIFRLSSSFNQSVTTKSNIEGYMKLTF